MNKILLIARQEFLNRVRKRSFLIATVVVPLIFPAIIAVLVYVVIDQERNADKEVVHYIDESGFFKPDNSQYIFVKFHGSLADAKSAFKEDESFGLLYVPPVSLSNPEGIVLYTRSNISPGEVMPFEWMFESQIRELKIRKFNLDQRVLDSLNTKIHIKTITLSEEGTEKLSDSTLSSGIGIGFGILMYMFIFIYGAQIMHGVIEEKTSKVVEVIVSSVRPFQLMMGKILGLASVGILQFAIWILIITTLSVMVLGYFGLNLPQEEVMKQINKQGVESSGAQMIFEAWHQISLGHLLFTFFFYFIGGYLLYGALFAAIGSAVDSPAEAQQFMFPITIPLFISYISLFMGIKPNTPVSVWLSLIPFTSPIAMMGRIAFKPPLWQEVVSMVLLVAGFIFTTWVAARIYRIGILMHGTKVNYKVLLKWFMMKG